MKFLIMLAGLAALALSVWVIVTYRRYTFPVIAFWLAVGTAALAVNIMDVA